VAADAFRPLEQLDLDISDTTADLQHHCPFNTSVGEYLQDAAGGWVKPPPAVALGETVRERGVELCVGCRLPLDGELVEEGTPLATSAEGWSIT
jgi:hypothetical protein